MKKITAINFLLGILLINFTTPIFAQVWMPLGENDFNMASASSTGYMDACMDAADIIYVAVDENDANGVTVRKWDGSTWSFVGTPTFTSSIMDIAVSPDGSALYLLESSLWKYNGTSWVSYATPSSTGQLLIDEFGNPWLAYADGTLSNKTTVKQFDGTSWVTMGSAGFTSLTNTIFGFAFDNTGTPAVTANGTIYKFDGASWQPVPTTVNYSGSVINLKFDASNTPYVLNGSAVQKLTGTTWGYVGPNIAFSGFVSQYMSMAISPAGEPYVSYKESSPSLKVIVKKFDGTSWVTVGPGYVTNTNTFENVIMVNSSNVPFVATSELSIGTNVRKFNGSTWEYTGTRGIYSFTSSFNDIAVNSLNEPYIAFQNTTNGKKATVAKYNGSTWDTLGTGFSAGQADNINIRIDASDNIYVSYKDAGNGNKATIMKYNGGGSWSPLGTAGFSPGIVNSLNMTLDNAGNPYVVFSDVTKTNKATVMKYDGSAWVVVGTTGFSSGAVNFTSIDLDASNNPYISFQDATVSNKLSVMKYDGTSWALVGTAGIGSLAVSTTRIGIDNSGKIFVAYKYNTSNSASSLIYDGTSWSGTGVIDSSTINTNGNLCFMIDKSTNTPVAAYTTFETKQATVRNYNSTLNAYRSVGKKITGSSAQNMSMTIDNSGAYYLIYSNTVGLFVWKYGNPACISPSINTQPSSLTKCVNGSATFSVTAAGTSLSYQWQDSTLGHTWTNISGATSASYTENTLTSGHSGNKYKCVITGSCGTITSNAVSLTVNALPTVNGGADITLCSGTSTTLSGSGAVSYSWTDGVTDGAAFTPASTITYTVTGTDANNCSNTDDVTVTVNSLPTVSGGADITLCSGTSTTLSGSGAVSYSWTDGVTDGVAFTPTSTITYTVTGTDANNCSNTDDVTVTVNSLPTVSGGSDENLCTGSSTILSGSGAVTYSWTNGVTDGVAFTPASTMTYTVTGTDANNCSNTDDVTVTLLTSSVIGDINCNGTIDNGEICGDKDKDGLIGTGEVAGDIDGDGIINGGEKTGDINGNGIIDGSEKEGDANGNEIIDNGEITTATLPQILNSECRFYPNPAQNYLHIESINQQEQNKLILYNAQGVELMNEQMNESNYTLDLSSYENGVYILKVEGSSGMLIERIIVNK